MGITVPLSLLLTMISLTSLVAGYALGRWRQASASTPAPKRRPSLEPTQDSPSPSALAQVQVDQASLYSTLEKLTTTVKRLSSRAGMQELRERRSSETDGAPEPPVGTSKAELLRHYGMSGKVGPAFTAAQQELELKKQH